MGERKASETQYFSRYLAVSPSFTGRLVFSGTEQTIDAEVVDVSRDGLGTLSKVALIPGSTIELEVMDARIGMRVVYCEPDLIYRDKFRCGLQRVGTTENLVNLFTAHGFLAER